MNFDPQLAEKYVEMLVRHDEVERALVVLDNLPAQYRERPPENLIRMKAEIMAARCTTHAYFTEGLDGEPSEEAAVIHLRGNARGVLIEWEVKKYNAQGKAPHLVDMGPGEYFIPIALKKLGYQFSYFEIACDGKTREKALPLIESVRCAMPSPTAPRIFLALEVIEHLPSTDDIAIECFRHVGGFPERIHLSTPKYTFHIQDKEWRKPCGLPHLRAYTPQEFAAAAHRIFPGYAWQLYDSKIISLRGMRGDVVDEAVLTEEDMPK